MEAKDTAYTERDIVGLRALAELDIHNGKEVLFNMDVAKWQAEISFKAGMQKIVDWIKEQPYLEMELGIEKWQAKLREWGVK